MSMEITNSYQNYTNTYTSPAKKQVPVKQEHTAGITNQSKSDNYLNELQKRHKELNIVSGAPDLGKKSGTSKTDVKIAPNILAQMASDPESAAKYEQMLSDIPRLNKWADSMVKSMTGSEVQYRQVWIVENGDMGSFAITGPSKEQKEAEEAARNKKQAEKESRSEKRKEEQIRFEKWLKRDKEYEIQPMSQAEMNKAIQFDFRM